MQERTLAIIKPDGVLRNLVGDVIKRIEETGLRIIGMKMIRMNKEQENLVMSVGGDVTDNRLTVGRKRVKFNGITGDGVVIRIYLMEAARQ